MSIPRWLMLASLMALAYGAQAQQFSPPTIDPAANLTETQRQQMSALFSKSNEVMRQLEADQKRRLQIVSQRWRGESLYNEIVNHPNCKKLKDQVVVVSKNREFNYEVASALHNIRQYARSVGCIPYPAYQQGRR